MPIQKDDSGRRFVAVEVEVPGAPEDVWAAIATGPGVTSWFVPTRVEFGDDDRPSRMICDFGPGMESVSTVTEWDPPRRLAAESNDLGPGAPPIATEWIVEAKNGGTCVVRVVHSLFTTADDWDDQLGAWEGGWPDFFRILSLYLSHFSGQRCAPVQVQAMTAMAREAAWGQFGKALGVGSDTVEGGMLRSAGGAPALVAHVECTGSPGHPEELLLRVAEPMPGIAHMFALAMGEQTLLSVRFYLYGEAENVAGQMQGAWQSWLESVVPAIAAPE